MKALVGSMVARGAAVAILVAGTALVAIRVVAPQHAAPAASPTASVAARPAPAKQAAGVPKPAPAPTKVAAAMPAPLVIRRILDTGGPIRFGSYFWDDTGVPAGPVTITVDLKASVLSVFRDGYEIGTAAVIYGADHKPTPLGTFPILQKDRHHFSSTYHHAPMPYTLRLTGDGVSIHGSKIAADYATHGCVGVPTDFARRLFEVAKVGDPVIVTNQGLRGDSGKPQTIVG